MTPDRLTRITQALAVLWLSAGNVAAAEDDNNPNGGASEEGRAGGVLSTTVVPLGDVEPEKEDQPENPQSSRTVDPSGPKTNPSPDLDAEKSAPPTTRGTLGVGLQLALPSQRLQAVTNEAGFGAFFYFGLGPIEWPVLFGLSFD
jgi:hypothetical protein